MFRKLLEKVNFACLAALTEWLIETWALVRGLIILALVVISIVMNLAETQKEHAIKIYHAITATK